MGKIKFTVIVVTYNSGDKLKTTLDNIYLQEYRNFEVIIKDGGSTDGSLDSLHESGYFEDKKESAKIIAGPDRGIYDAMNAAVKEISDKSYVIFMNCGDTFHDKQVLGKVADYVEEVKPAQDAYYIFYGNQYNELTGTVVSSAPRLNEFALFRNVPCHQVCFYSSDLFNDREDGKAPYNTAYKVRADYEHFLYSVYEKKAMTQKIDIIVSDYEGGGYSETVENRKISNKEHIIITNQYMKANAGKYRLIMKLSGAGLRTKIAESKSLSGIYNKIKSAIYRK